MISIQLDRLGPVVVASTVNDLRETTVALGLTSRAAERRLVRKVGRQ